MADGGAGPCAQRPGIACADQSDRKSGFGSTPGQQLAQRYQIDEGLLARTAANDELFAEIADTSLRWGIVAHAPELSIAQKS